jgi:hypothetical protein
MQSITLDTEFAVGQTFRAGRTAYFLNFLGGTFTPVTVTAILPEEQALIVSLTDGSEPQIIPTDAFVAFRHSVPSDLAPLTGSFGAC